MKIGDKVIWIRDCDTPNDFERATVTHLDTDWVRMDSGHIISRSFVFPAAAEDDLNTALLKRRELKRAYDQSMSLIFEIRNRASRGEY